MQNTHPGAVHGSRAAELRTSEITPPALEIEGQSSLSPSGPSVALQVLASPGVMGIGSMEFGLLPDPDPPQAKKKTATSIIIKDLLLIGGVYQVVS
jgi:hypothetical protein